MNYPAASCGVSQGRALSVRHHGFSHSSLYRVTSKQAPRNLLIKGITSRQTVGLFSHRFFSVSGTLVVITSCRAPREHAFAPARQFPVPYPLMVDVVGSHHCDLRFCTTCTE